MSRTILALALANSVSALLLPANPGRVAKVHMAATEPAAPAVAKEPKDFPHPAYEGLVLPYGTGATKDNTDDAVQMESVKFLFGIGGGSPMLGGPAKSGAVLGPGKTGVFMKDIVDKGLLKSDPHSLDELQKFVKAGLETHNAAAVPGLAPMPEDYNFFGGDDLAAQLCVLLESNPFYASSLTPRAGGGFEIINFVCHAAQTPDSQIPDRLAISATHTHTFEPCVEQDPAAKDADASYNVRIMRTMGRPGPQVNFQFSVKPEGGLKIDGYDVYENGASRLCTA